MYYSNEHNTPRQHMFSPSTEIVCVFVFYLEWTVLMMIWFVLNYKTVDKFKKAFNNQLKFLTQKTFQGFVLSGTAVTMSLLGRSYGLKASSVACGVLTILQVVTHQIYLYYRLNRHLHVPKYVLVPKQTK